MKFKIILVGLLLATMSHLVADCNKNEVIKLIDNGFAKSEIDNICGKSDNTKAKWTTPSDSKCISYGGKIDNGVCSATWETAKSICYGVDGRLPSINELRKVVVDCGGIIDQDDKNKKNASYQSCYKEKGFDPSYYWSSTTSASNMSIAWVVAFYSGYDLNNDKTYRRFVRCVNTGL